jgi:hypothetical protein
MQASVQVFGRTMMFCGLGMLCGEPGAWLTLFDVTVNTYNLLAVGLSAYR